MKPLPDDFIEVQDRHGRAFRFAESVDPEHAGFGPALRRLLASKGGAAKARVLDARCPNHHRVGQVVRLDVGTECLLWIGQAPARTRSGAAHRVLRLFLLHPENAAEGDTLEAECSCGSWMVPTPWVAERLAEGRQRAMVPTGPRQGDTFAGVVFDEGRPDLLR